MSQEHEGSEFGRTVPVLLTSEAEAEMQDTAHWYNDQRPGLGLEFLAAAGRTLESLARWPRSGKPVEGVANSVDARRMRITRFPYYVAYVLVDDGATVVAVAHERRLPKYWIGRVNVSGDRSETGLSP